MMLKLNKLKNFLKKIDLRIFFFYSLLLWLLGIFREPILEYVFSFEIVTTIFDSEYYYNQPAITILPFIFSIIYPIVKYALGFRIKTNSNYVQFVLFYLAFIFVVNVSPSIGLPTFDSGFIITFLFIPIPILVALNWVKEFNEIAEDGFIEDDVYKLIGDSLPSRKDYALKIAQTIASTSTNQSFSIAVHGEWGAGKTVFLRQIEEELPDKVEVIHFQPWLYKSDEKYAEKLLELLIERVEKFDIQLAKKMASYASEIIGSENFWQKLINSFYSTEKITLKTLNDLLENTSFKIVVFIDDVDRFTQSEIFEILRLIRSSVSFRNTFFITAFDYQYLFKTVESQSNFQHNAADFHRKMFQMEVSLPVFDKRILADILLKQLTKTLRLEKDSAEALKLSAAFRELSENRDDIVYIVFKHQNDGVLESHLHSFRDVVRFCNSFKIIYQLISHEELLFKDLIVIELLRCSYPGLYQKLRKKEVMVFNPKIEDISKKQEWKKLDETPFNDILSQLGLTSSKKIIDKSLNELLSNTDMRAFKYTENFHLYFGYHLGSKASITKFNSMAANFDGISQFVETCQAEGKTNNLLEVIEDYFVDDIEKAKKITITFLILGAIHLNTYERTANNIGKIISLKDGFENYDQFVRQELIDTRYNSLVRNNAASGLWQYSQENKDDSEKFKSVNWREIQVNILQEAINANAEYATVSNIFYSIHDHVDNNYRIYLFKKSIDVFKEYLENHKLEYINALLRPSSLQTRLSRCFDPYMMQIFGSTEEVEGFICQSTHANKELFLKYLSYGTRQEKFDINEEEEIILEQLQK